LVRRREKGGSEALRTKKFNEAKGVTAATQAVPTRKGVRTRESSQPKKKKKKTKNKNRRLVQTKW